MSAVRNAIGALASVAVIIGLGIALSPLISGDYESRVWLYGALALWVGSGVLKVL